MAETDSRLAQELATQWVESFKQLFSSMAARESLITTNVLDPAHTLQADQQDWMWLSQEFNVVEGPALWIGADKATWQKVGGAVLAGLGIDEASPEDCESTLRDLLAQSTSALIQELGKQIGASITCGDLLESETPAAQVMLISAEDIEQGSAVEFALTFSPSLLEALDKLSSSSPQEADEEPAPSAPSTGAGRSRQLPRPVADLRLQLQVNLGRTALPLSNVLKLNVGSVIGLNRSLTDPVDVVINGRVIASGQVVVCNGNYAVEITSAGLHGAA